MTLTRLRALLPDLVHAGRTALALQRDGPLMLPVKEEYDDAMGQALTIADPVVQAFLEGRFSLREPHVRLELEEEPFRFLPSAEGADGTLWLDPIDGTRYYADGLPIFGISLAWTRGGRIVGAIYLVPALDLALVGARGEGAEPVTLADEPVVMWSRIQPEARQALQADGITVIDPNGAYDPGAGLAAWHLLRGGLGGLVMPRGAHCRDGGALAFLAQEAGASVTTPAGQPWEPEIDERGYAPPAVCAASEALGARLRALL